MSDRTDDDHKSNSVRTPILSFVSRCLLSSPAVSNITTNCVCARFNTRVQHESMDMAMFMSCIYKRKKK